MKRDKKHGSPKIGRDNHKTNSRVQKEVTKLKNNRITIGSEDPRIPVLEVYRILAATIPGYIQGCFDVAANVTVIVTPGDPAEFVARAPEVKSSPVSGMVELRIPWGAEEGKADLAERIASALFFLATWERCDEVKPDFAWRAWEVSKEFGKRVGLMWSRKEPFHMPEVEGDFWERIEALLPEGAAM